MERRWRAAMIVAVIALIAGAAGFIAALGDPFANPEGSLLGKLLHFNQLGALVTAALALVALAGGVTGKRPFLTLAGAGFALCAVLTIVQTGRDPNWLGGRGNTLSLFLACAVGLLVLALVPTEVRGEVEEGGVSNDTPRA
jgi:hypothetical protein